MSRFDSREHRAIEARRPLGDALVDQAAFRLAARRRAQRAGIPLRFPPVHPFNPLPVLRLAIALDNRVDVIDRLFRHIWLEGRASDTVDSLADLGREFAIELPSTLADDAVKAALRSNTQRAIDAGVFGVPTMQVGTELFWGADSGQLLREYLESPERFETDERLLGAHRVVRLDLRVHALHASPVCGRHNVADHSRFRTCRRRGGQLLRRYLLGQEASRLACP